MTAAPKADEFGVRLDAPRHPTLEECEAAGRGPINFPGKPYDVGGLPDTPEERARFEAYMRGHCWAVGNYDEALRCYDTVPVRQLYGVWRDRGSLAAQKARRVARGVDLPHSNQPLEAHGTPFRIDGEGHVRFADGSRRKALETELAMWRVLHPAGVEASDSETFCRTRQRGERG